MSTTRTAAQAADTVSSPAHIHTDTSLENTLPLHMYRLSRSMRAVPSA